MQGLYFKKLNLNDTNSTHYNVNLGFVYVCSLVNIDLYLRQQEHAYIDVANIQVDLCWLEEGNYFVGFLVRQRLADLTRSG